MGFRALIDFGGKDGYIKKGNEMIEARAVEAEGKIYFVPDDCYTIDPDVETGLTIEGEAYMLIGNESRLADLSLHKKRVVTEVTDPIKLKRIALYAEEDMVEAESPRIEKTQEPL